MTIKQLILNLKKKHSSLFFGKGPLDNGFLEKTYRYVILLTD
jgi:hypothetical protein